jgi:hypothetical protein
MNFKTAVVILLAVIIYCFGTRYQMVPQAMSGDNVGMAYMFDRMSGKGWAMMDNKYVPIELVIRPK